MSEQRSNPHPPRNHRLDNARGVLIFLVVFGHLLERANGWTNPLLRIPLTAIYVFHMAAFTTLSGVTSKAERWLDRITQWALLLLVFQCAYAIVQFPHGHPWNLLFQPIWLLWYLLALIGWTMMLPWWRRLPWPVVSAFTLAIAVGWIPQIGYALSLSRALVLFPFFVAGNLYGKPWLNDTPTSNPFSKPWITRSAGLASIILVVILLNLNPPHEAFYLSLGFRAFGGSPIFEMAIRAAILLAAATSTLFLMATITAKSTVFSRWGIASLSIYLLHGFWVLALSYLLKSTSLKMPPLFVMLSAGVLAIGITVLCSLPPFERAIRSLPRRLLSWQH